MNSMLDTLLKQPLFSGASKEKMAEVVGKFKFHFLKFSDGEVVVRAGEPCTHIRFLISGEVRASIASNDNRFVVSQTLKAPDVIAPSFLFGPKTTYPMTVISRGTVSILQLSKSDYLEMLHHDQAFMLNFLNTLSKNAQKSVDGMMTFNTGNLPERIAFWIMSLTQPSGTDITLESSHRAIYSLFGVQRSSFMSTMENLAAQGILSYDAQCVTFTSREALAKLVQSAQYAQIEEPR